MCIPPRSQPDSPAEKKQPNLVARRGKGGGREFRAYSALGRGRRAYLLSSNPILFFPSFPKVIALDDLLRVALPRGFGPGAENESQFPFHRFHRIPVLKCIRRLRSAKR